MVIKYLDNFYESTFKSTQMSKYDKLININLVLGKN